MKGCKLCEILDHQQKLNGRLDREEEVEEENKKVNNTSSHRRVCNHIGSNYGSLDHFRDMFLAAHLLRGEFVFGFLLLFLFADGKKTIVV